MTLIPPPLVGAGQLNVGTTGFPAIIQPFPNITPFTYRDGMSWAETLEDYQQWILTKLVPHVDATGDTISGAYNAASQALASAMTEYAVEIGADRNAFEATVTARLTEMGQKLGDAQAAQNAAEAARDIAEQWAAQTHALQDDAVSALIGESASGTRGVLDARYQGVRSVREFGAKGDGVADDTAAIQAALNTGANVVLPAVPGRASTVYRTSATLTMKTSGQRIVGNDVSIAPEFRGDVLVLTQPLQRATVNIVGTLQPAAGDYTEVAGIRIGGPNANPMSGGIPGSTIQNFKGNGVIWENGAMMDFSQVFITDVTVDGIRCTETYYDNNHGLFSDVHIIRAARDGYSIRGKKTTDINLRSRSHQFIDSKAFNCGRNYYIETLSNVGTVFSEQSIAPCEFSVDSNGNYIQFISTETDYEKTVDNGVGNVISGYSRFGYWDERVTQSRKLRVNNLFEGRLELTQTAKNTFTFNGVDTAEAITLTRNHLGGSVFIDDYTNSWITAPGGGYTQISSKRQQITIPANTSVPAGGVYLANPDNISNVGPGWLGQASIAYGGGLTLICTVNIHPAGYSRIAIFNPTTAAIDISGAVVQAVYMAYLN